MWAKIPVIGWLWATFLYACMAIPFTLLWHWLGPKFFSFVPQVYLDITYIEAIGLFLLISILKHVFYPNFHVTSNSKIEQPEKKA